jgi:large subunit ribosomal protein L29
MLKTGDLRNLSKQELKEKLTNLKKSLYELQVKKATGRIEKPSKVSEARRNVARVLTVLGEKEK